MKYKDLVTIKRILGDMYIENGNIEEVVLLSQAVDKIIVSMQKKHKQKNINKEIKTI